MDQNYYHAKAMQSRARQSSAGQGRAVAKHGKAGHGSAWQGMAWTSGKCHWPCQMMWASSSSWTSRPKIFGLPRQRRICFLGRDSTGGGASSDLVEWCGFPRPLELPAQRNCPSQKKCFPGMGHSRKWRVCVYVCMYVCKYVCTYVRMYVCNVM